MHYTGYRIYLFTERKDKYAAVEIRRNGYGKQRRFKKIDAKGEEVSGVRMVNANHETGVVVVTHTADGFDQATFKAAIAELGFNS